MHPINTRSKVRLTMLTLLAVWVLLLLISLAVGRYPLHIKSLLEGDAMQMRIFRQLRLPRGVMALLAGFSLGLAGSVYQCVFRNPLASPDIIGTASGASVGAAAAILFLGGGAAATSFASFLGGSAAVCSCFLLCRLTGKNNRMTLLLTGILMNAFFQAILMILKTVADPEKELAAIEFWLMGSLADVTLARLRRALPFMLTGILGCVILERPVEMLQLPDDEAVMLGLPVRLTRFLALAFATLASGSVISFCGLITFVGLLAPHIARLMLGAESPASRLLSGLVGGALLLLADVFTRLISDAELPISVITSLLGAPLLFLMLYRKGAMPDE